MEVKTLFSGLMPFGALVLIPGERLCQTGQTGHQTGQTKFFLCWDQFVILIQCPTHFSKVWVPPSPRHICVGFSNPMLSNCPALEKQKDCSRGMSILSVGSCGVICLKICHPFGEGLGSCAAYFI